MLEALAVSQILLWVLLLVMAAVILGLVRQIGVLHERIAPMGALTIDHGPKVGENAPIFELKDLRGAPLKAGGSNPDGKSTLLLFLSPTCPVCKKLLPIVKSIAQSEARWLRLVLASDGENPADHERFVRARRLEPFPYAISGELGMAYRVGKLPYAVLIDEAGVVRAKGLVNTREHLESIIEAKRIGVASIQEYLKARSQTPDEPQPLSVAEKGGN